MNDYSTKQLVDELMQREGVEVLAKHDLEGLFKYKAWEDEDTDVETVAVSGPHIILRVID